MEKFNAMRTRLLQHLQKKAIRSKSIMTLVCLLLASASAFAQTKTVTGTVTDAANEPLIGASVLVQGTSHSEAHYLGMAFLFSELNKLTRVKV